MVQIHSPRPNFSESATCNFRKSSKDAMSAWYETRCSGLRSVLRERWLSREIIALRQVPCSTENPDSREIRYKIRPLGRKTRSAVHTHRPARCNYATALIG